MKQNKNINMCEGPLFKNILKFSFPFMLTGLSQQLYNAADVIVVGRYAGQNALAGVGSTGSLITLILTLFLGLSAGVSVTAGRAMGAKDSNGISQIVHTAILISILSGVAISVFGFIFTRPLLNLIDVPAEVMPQAEIYMKIIFIGKTPTLIYNFGSAILRAKGDTKRPLYIVTISGIINVLLNLFFVIKLNMAAGGVALATTISQLFTAIAIIFILYRETDSTKLCLKKLKIHKKQLLSIIKIGLPSGFQSMVFSISNVLIQSSVNSFGPVAVAGNAASANIGSFYYVALNTFFHTSMAFVSQNMGAKKYDRIKKSVGCCLIAVCIVWAIESAITVLFGKHLISFYAPGNTEAIKMGLIRLSIVGCTYGLCGCMEVMNGALRGIGYSFTNMLLSILGVCGIRIVWIFTAFRAIGTFSSLFYSLPLSWIGTLLMNSLFFFYAINKIKKNSYADALNQAK